MSVNNRFRDKLGKVSKAAPVKNQQAVLDVLVKGICRSFESLIPDILQRLLDSLQLASAEAKKNENKNKTLGSVHKVFTVLDTHKKDFHKNLNQTFEANLTQALDNLAAAESFWPEMHADDIDKMFLLRGLATKLQTEYHELLFELSGRLATVVGASEISPGLNPLRPALVVDSIYETWQGLKIEHDTASDLLFLEKITPQVIGDLRPMYRDSIDILARLNIKPAADSSSLDQVPTSANSDAGVIPNSAISQSDAPAPSASQGSFFQRIQAWMGKSGKRNEGTDSVPLPELSLTELSRDGGDYLHTHSDHAANHLTIALLGQVASRLPSSVSSATAPVQLASTSVHALTGLLGSDAGTNVVTALDHLQSAQLQQPEKFRDALAPNFLETAPSEDDAATYIDPVSLPDNVTGRTVQFVNVIRSIQQSEIGRRASPLNAGVIELVARVFDFVFQDTYLPDAIKLLLSRLQIPLLKAALLDVSFFEQNDHPARKLVNILALAGMGWQEADSHQAPLFVLIENTVNRVVADFKDDLSLFESLAQEVFLFVKKQEEEAQREAAAETEKIQLVASETENKELADRAARQVIEERLSEKLTTPFVSDFLRNTWAKYVGQLLLSSENDTTQLSYAVTTADDLLWSVEPKNDRLQRVRMLAKIPIIENQIRTALTYIHWPNEDASIFFRQLDDRWAGAVIGEPIVIEDGSNANEEDLDSRMDRLAEDDAATQLVMQMEPGDMLELIKDDGAIFSYKLGWVSEAKTRFLLTNRLNSAPLIVTAKYLAQQYQQGKMRLIDRKPFMDRALGSILDALEETRYPEEMMHETGAY